MAHGRIHIIIKLGIIHQQAESTLVAVQLFCKCLCILQCLVDTIQRTLYIQRCRLEVSLFVLSKTPLARLIIPGALLVETCHQRIQLTGRNRKIARNGLHIMQRSSQCRICQERIQATQDRIQFREHLLDSITIAETLPKAPSLTAPGIMPPASIRSRGLLANKIFTCKLPIRSFTISA